MFKDGEEIRSIGLAEIMRPYREEGGTRIGLAFAVQGEKFAIALSERSAAELFLHLMAVLRGGDRHQKRTLGRSEETGRETSLSVRSVQLAPPDEGGARVALVDLGDLTLALRLPAACVEDLRRQLPANDG